MKSRKVTKVLALAMTAALMAGAAVTSFAATQSGVYGHAPVEGAVRGDAAPGFGDGYYYYSWEVGDCGGGSSHGSSGHSGGGSSDGGSSSGSSASAVASTSSVTVGGVAVKSTVSGAYSAKSVNGVAVLADVATIAQAFGLGNGEKAYAMVMDLDPKVSYAAMNCLNLGCAMVGGTMGPVLNLNLCKVNQMGVISKLTGEGKIPMAVGIPASFLDPTAKYGVIAVYRGGIIEVLEDLDADPATITFNAKAGEGAYALVKLPQ